MIYISDSCPGLRATGHGRRVTSMSVRIKISSFLGLLAGILLAIFGKSRNKPTITDLKQAEFKTSTQRLGIRFTERIRDVFRFRWLKRK